jgi:hypothetical protein
MADFTVAELIERLSEFPPYRRIRIGAAGEIRSVREVQMDSNVDSAMPEPIVIIKWAKQPTQEAPDAGRRVDRGGSRRGRSNPNPTNRS